MRLIAHRYTVVGVLKAGSTNPCLVERLSITYDPDSRWPLPTVVHEL